MRRVALISVVGFLLALLIPGAVAAQGVSDDDSFMMRVEGGVTIAPDERIGMLFVINGDAVIDGTVDDTLLVVNGDATVRGRVTSDVIVVSGTLTLGQGSTVGDVSLFRSELTREQGATITGDLTESSNVPTFGWAANVLSILFWIGSTLLVLVAGLAFAAFGGRQLGETSRLLTERPLASVLTMLAVWIGLPILIAVAFVTVIGIPLAIAISLFLLPLLWLLGYLVASTRLGGAILGAFNRGPLPERPYLAVTIGVLCFQLLGFVPILGGLVLTLAAFVGSGALVYRVYLSLRGRQTQPSPALQPKTSPI